VHRLKDAAYREFGEVGVLMEQRGDQRRRRAVEKYDIWRADARRQSLGRHQRRPRLRACHDRGKGQTPRSSTPASKQGITMPPGNNTSTTSPRRG